MLPFLCYCADTKTVAQQKGWGRWAPGPAVSENGVKTLNFNGILTIFQWSIPLWTIFFWHILRHFFRDSHFRGSGWHWVQLQIDPGSEPEPRLWCIRGHWAPTWIIPRYHKWQRCLIKILWYLWDGLKHLESHQWSTKVFADVSPCWFWYLPYEAPPWYSWLKPPLDPRFLWDIQTTIFRKYLWPWSPERPKALKIWGFP